MAITLISKPSGLNLAYRPIVYKWSSNAFNLKYCVAEVIISSVRVSAISVELDSGSSSNFTLDVSEVCQANLSFDLQAINSSGVISPVNSQKTIQLKVYEVTENPSTGVLVTDYDPSDANNSSYQYLYTPALIVNWIVSHFDYATFNQPDYTLTSSTKKFLTDSPIRKSIELDTDEFIGILQHAGDAGKNFKLEILTYNSSDALLNTDNINITEWDSAYAPTIPNNTYLTLAVGTKNLINSGVSLTNVAYYTIKVINDDGDMSETKRYDIVNSCTQDVRIHWVNNYGKQDSYTFKGNVQEELKHKATTYNQPLGLTYSSEARGVSVLQNTSNTSFNAYSKSMGRDEYHWLSSILTNKMAFVEINNNYFPIIIEDGTILKTDEKDMPIQFVLNYSFANATKGIRG
tara:strand:- start:5415 stop:6626 length:1212 start_codon:yes stop_codon:yes gene_type:complete